MMQPRSMLLLGMVLLALASASTLTGETLARQGMVYRRNQRGRFRANVALYYIAGACLIIAYLVKRFAAKG